MESIFTVLKEACENAGYTVRSYSGRGMYGRSCIGVECENPVKAAFEIAAAMTVDYDDCEEWLSELARDASTDSMGRDAILYFPSVGWVAEESGATEATDEENERVAKLGTMAAEKLELVVDAEAPRRYSIWLVLEDDRDIVGAGDTFREAFEEAREELGC